MATGRATKRLTFEYVAARAFEIDEDDVGIDRPDAVEQFRRVIDPHHAHVPGRAQAFLDDGGAQRILVDDGNAQIPAQRSSMAFMDAYLHVAGQGMIFARGSRRARVEAGFRTASWPERGATSPSLAYTVQDDQ